MSCTGYQPVFQKQLDGTRFAGENCTCASAGMACDDDTCGIRKPSSSQVRFWTGDTSGGTNLAQVDAALRANTPTDLDVRYRYPWADFVRRVNAGASAILQGGYAPIRDSRFRGSETFGGNHAIFVTPRLVAMDPLADGRRPGLYKYHGESYPESLLRLFAARLNVSGLDSYIPLGDGLVYAAFTRDNDVTYVAHANPGTTFTRYFVTNGKVTGHQTRVTKTGWTLPCSPPRLYPNYAMTLRVSLVQLHKPGSSMDGWWVNAKYVRTIP